jgi:hypothetical protein
LGGLGNDPEPDNENDPLLRLKHSLEESKTKVNKIQFFKNKEPDNKEEYECFELYNTEKKFNLNN